MCLSIHSKSQFLDFCKPPFEPKTINLCSLDRVSKFTITTYSTLWKAKALAIKRATAFTRKKVIWHTVDDGAKTPFVQTFIIVRTSHQKSLDKNNINRKRCNAEAISSRRKKHYFMILVSIVLIKTLTESRHCHTSFSFHYIIAATSHQLRPHTIRFVIYWCCRKFEWTQNLWFHSVRCSVYSVQFFIYVGSSLLWPPHIKMVIKTDKNKHKTHFSKDYNHLWCALCNGTNIPLQPYCSECVFVFGKTIWNSKLRETYRRIYKAITTK